MLRRNRDLAVSASSAAVLYVLGVPWLYWGALGLIVAYQVGWRRRASR